MDGPTVGDDNTRIKESDVGRGTREVMGIFALETINSLPDEALSNLN